MHESRFLQILNNPIPPPHWTHCSTVSRTNVRTVHKITFQTLSIIMDCNYTGLYCSFSSQEWPVSPQMWRSTVAVWWSVPWWRWGGDTGATRSEALFNERKEANIIPATLCACYTHWQLHVQCTADLAKLPVAQDVLMHTPTVLHMKTKLLCLCTTNSNCLGNFSLQFCRVNAICWLHAN